MRFKWKMIFVLGISILFLVANNNLCRAETSLSYPEPSINIAIGECQWNGSQSITAVTFTVTNTKMTVIKPSGGSFPVVPSISPATVNLPSGVYSYTWKDDYDPIYGIWLKTVHGSFELLPCIPQASVTFDHGTCQWDATNGSNTPITIELDHAELTLNGLTYTSSPTTVNFAHGTYSYSWVPTDGYQGGESDQTLTVGNCNPTASVSHITGDCHYTAGQSSTSVLFNIIGADVVVNGSGGDVYYTTQTSSSLSLPAGLYTYTWDVLPHYNGENGSRSFTLGTCIPASVSYDIGECNWDTQPPSRSLSFTVSGAAVTLKGPGGLFPAFSSNKILENLLSGIYSFDWLANPGYAGSGHVDLELPICQPGVAAAAVNFIACGFDDQNNPYGEVAVSLSGSELSINGEVLGETTTLFLPPGNYEYSWWAKYGFEGEGEGEINTEICAPKSSPEVRVDKGSCAIKNGQSLTDVSLVISGAELSLTNSKGDNFGLYTSSQTIHLPPGEYHYEWTSTTGDESQGEGKFTITACETEKESDIQDKDNEVKEEEGADYDPTPDYPAGGLGPLKSILALFYFSLGMTFIRFVLLFRRINS